jgi:hypothetical protein
VLKCVKNKKIVKLHVILDKSINNKQLGLQCLLPFYQADEHSKEKVLESPLSSKVPVGSLRADFVQTHVANQEIEAFK